MRKKTVTQNGLGIIRTVYGKENPLLKNVTEFATIKSWGDKNSAITHDGHKVERQEYFFFPEFSTKMIRATPYELHFIFEDKSKKRGRWTLMCTCGSPAGIVSYKDMNNLMSPTLGELVICCLAHNSSKMNTGIGRHADNSTE